MVRIAARDVVVTIFHCMYTHTRTHAFVGVIAELGLAGPPLASQVRRRAAALHSTVTSAYAARPLVVIFEECELVTL